MIWRIAAIVLAVAVAVMTLVALRAGRETPAPALPPIRAAIEPPPGAELGAGDDVLDAAVSPDGREIVFVATSAGVPRLWRRAFDADRAEPVPGTEGASLPAWNGGGGVVSFFAGTTLKQIAQGPFARGRFLASRWITALCARPAWSNQAAARVGHERCDEIAGWRSPAPRARSGRRRWRFLVRCRRRQRPARCAPRP
jgi:hypothetical protein